MKKNGVKMWVVLQPNGDIEFGVLAYTRRGAIEGFEERVHWAWQNAKEHGYRIVRALVSPEVKP